MHWGRNTANAMAIYKVPGKQFIDILLTIWSLKSAIYVVLMVCILCGIKITKKSKDAHIHDDRLMLQEKLDLGIYHLDSYERN